MKVKVHTLDGKAAKGDDRAQRRGVRRRAARRHPAPRRHLAAREAPRHRPRAPASAPMSPAPARSSVARRAAVPPVTAIAALRSSSAAARRTARAVRDFNPSLNKKIRALGLKMALSSQGQGRLAGRPRQPRSSRTPRPRRSPAQLAQARLRQAALVIDGDAVDDGFALAARQPAAASTCCRRSAPTSTTS